MSVWRFSVPTVHGGRTFTMVAEHGAVMNLVIITYGGLSEVECVRSSFQAVFVNHKSDVVRYLLVNAILLLKCVSICFFFIVPN